jgi:tetratricopeptide (TPR) repeat protein/ankyrin repeat protein
MKRVILITVIFFLTYGITLAQWTINGKRYEKLDAIVMAIGLSKENTTVVEGLTCYEKYVTYLSGYYMDYCRNCNKEQINVVAKTLENKLKAEGKIGVYSKYAIEGQYIGIGLFNLDYAKKECFPKFPFGISFYATIGVSQDGRHWEEDAKMDNNIFGCGRDCSYHVPKSYHYVQPVIRNKIEQESNQVKSNIEGLIKQGKLNEAKNAIESAKKHEFANHFDLLGLGAQLEMAQNKEVERQKLEKEKTQSQAQQNSQSSSSNQSSSNSVINNSNSQAKDSYPSSNSYEDYKAQQQEKERQEYQKQQEMLKQKMIEQKEKIAKIERAVTTGTQIAVESFARIGAVKADISLIKASSSPEIALSNYTSELSKIKQQQQTIYSNFTNQVSKVNNMISQATTKQEGIAAGFAFMAASAAAIAEKRRLEKEKERLEMEYQSKMNGFKNELITKNQTGYTNSIIYAVNELSEKQEKYYLELADYYNCCKNFINSNFSYYNTTWIGTGNCYKPNNPNSSLNEYALTSNQFLEIAKRKQAHGNRTNNRDFLNASLYFLNRAVEKDNKNPEIYSYRAEMQSQHIDKIIDINYAIYLNPKNENYKTQKQKYEKIFSNELFTAIERNNVEYIKKAVTYNLHADLVDKNLNTPIMAAIAINNPTIFNILLGSENIKKTLLEKNGSNYLFYASMNNSVDIIKSLERDKVNINIRESDGKSAFYLATISKSEDVLDFLLSKGYDYEVTLKDLTANKEELSVKFLSSKVLSSILENGYDLQKDASKNVEKILRYDKTLFYNTYGNKEIFIETAVRMDNVNLLDIFIKNGADINTSSSKQKSLIGISIESNSNKCFNYMIKNNVNLNVEVLGGGTLIHNALKNKNLEAFDNLLLSKIQTNIVDDEGNTILSLVVQNGQNDELIKLTSKRNDINPNLPNKREIYPIHFAIQSNRLDIIKNLISLGANINATDKNLKTPLHYAAESGDMEIIELLLMNKADLAAKDIYKKTPYNYAQSDKNKILSSFLKQKMKDDANYGVIFDVQNISCRGYNDGTISATVTGGFPPFNYDWYSFPNNKTNSIEKLKPGYYKLKVTDARNIEFIDSTYVKEPESLMVQFNKEDETYYGANDGKVSAIVQGGTSPYSYTWSNESNKKKLTNLEPNLYYLNVKDKNGCLLESMTEIQASSVQKIDKKSLAYNTQLAKETSSKEVNKTPKITDNFNSKLAVNAWLNQVNETEDKNVNIKFSKEEAISLMNNSEFQNALQILLTIEKNTEPTIELYFLLGSCYDSLSDYRNAEIIYSKMIAMDSKNSDIYALRAGTFVNRSLNKKAIQDYNKALDLDPNNMDVNYKLAQLYLKLKQWKNLENQYTLILAKNPKDYYTVYFERGEVYFSKNDFYGALKDYSNYIKYDSLNAQVYFKRGLAYNKAGNVKLASNDFENALLLGLDEGKYKEVLNISDRYYVEGLSFLNKGDNSKALRSFSNSIIINPNQNRALLERGQLLILSKSYEEALDDFSRAIEVSSTYDSAYYFRGLVYEKLNQEEEAYNDYKKSIDLSSKFFEPYPKIAALEKKNKNYEDAIKYYLDAISIKPKLDYLYPEIAEAYYLTNKYKLAVDYANKGIDRNKYNEKNYYISGLSYYAIGDFKTADFQFSNAINLKSNYAEAYYAKGNALYSMAKFSSTIHQYNQAIKYKENYSEAYLMRGRANYNLKLFSSAEKDYIKSFELNANLQNDTTYLELGLIYLEGNQANNLQKAKNYIQKSIDISPSAKKYYHLGRALSKDQQYDDALTNLSKALSLDKNLWKIAQKDIFYKLTAKSKIHKKEFLELIKSAKIV